MILEKPLKKFGRKLCRNVFKNNEKTIVNVTVTDESLIELFEVSMENNERNDSRNP